MAIAVCRPNVAPSVGRRAARPARARPARRGDGAARADPLRRSGRQRQDDDARRPRRVAHRLRRGGRRRDRRDHVQQAGRGGASGAAGGRARAARRRRRRRRSASGRSMRSGSRSCATPAQPVEPLVDRMAILRRVAPDAGPAGWRALDTAISRLKLDLGVEAADGRRRPGRRARSRGRSSPTRRQSPTTAASTSTTSSPGRSAPSRRTPALLERWRTPMRAPARRRGAGPRSGPAPDGAAPRRAGEPGLLRRRRRPVDLRLAAGRCPPSPVARRRRCRGCGASTSW